MLLPFHCYFNVKGDSKHLANNTSSLGACSVFRMSVSHKPFEENIRLKCDGHLRMSGSACALKQCTVVTAVICAEWQYSHSAVASICYSSLCLLLASSLRPTLPHQPPHIDFSHDIQSPQCENDHPGERVESVYKLVDCCKRGDKFIIFLMNECISLITLSVP